MIDLEESFINYKNMLKVILFIYKHSVIFVYKGNIYILIAYKGKQRNKF